jgi:AcrR family transcriptional regulator
VDAAAGLFITRGYGGTTVDAIAEAAGVSRKTVFTSVGGKIEALELAIEWAFAGDDEPVPMTERPHVKAAQAEPDARRILADHARTVGQVCLRTIPRSSLMRLERCWHDDSQSPLTRWHCPKMGVSSLNAWWAAGLIEKYRARVSERKL